MLSYISIFITIFLFSTIEVFSKMITGNVDPFLIAFSRFFFSGIILALIGIKQLKTINIKDMLFLFGLGLLGITIALGSFHYSIAGLNASTSAVIFSMNPLFSSLYAIFFLKEKSSKLKFVGILTGLFGVYIVCFGWQLADLTNIKYILFMLLSAVTFGTYIAATKPFVKKYGTFLTTGTIFISGSIPYLFLIKNFEITNFQLTIPVLLYLSLITTGLAYCLYFYGLKRVPVIVGTSMFYLKPILATIFAVVLLKESPALHFYIGVLIILSSMALTMVKLPKGKNRKAASNEAA